MASLLEKVVYRVRYGFPAVYRVLAWANATATVALHGRAIRRALANADVAGTVRGRPAVMRALTPADLPALHSFLTALPESHLRFFHPHGFDERSLRQVLKSRALLTYGMFREDALVAYAIIKLFANKKGFIGRLVAPDMAGMGVGRFLSRYLYWQGYRLGFKLRSTIHSDNLPSLRSHQAVRPFRIVAPLPNNYNLIEYSITDEDARPPTLALEPRPTKTQTDAPRAETR